MARELDRTKGLVARAFTFGAHDWQLSYYRGGREVVRVELDGRTGRLVGVWTGPQIEWPLARGAHGPHARRLHAFLILAGLLFLVPFVDPRRVFRLVHLDLLALLAFGVSQFFAARGQINLSVPLVYPPLVYLLVRMTALAVRPRPAEGRLTWLGPRALAVGLAALLVLRYGYDLIDSEVNDVGYASVFGADSIRNGFPLYDSSPASGHLDTYGPLAYLAYVPFETLFPLKGLAHSSAGAARPAAIVFDFATVVGLVLLGRRLRPAEEGTRLGLALGWAFAAYPWTLFVLSENTNDGLVAMFLVYALLSLASPWGRGLLLGLAAGAKFAPIALAGVFARVGGERGRRPLLVYATVLALAVAVPIVLYLPDGGVREFWDSTVGFQLSRSSPFSIWGLHPGWKPLHAPVSALVGAMALAALVLPRERGTVQLAAAGCVLLVGAQITARHWYYFYLPWFAPYALVALFSLSSATSVRNSGSSSDRAVASNTS